MSHTVCEKCGAYTHEWNTKEQHGFVNMEPCPDMSDEEIKKQLIIYFKEFQKHNKKYSDVQSNAQLKINKAKKEQEFWKGKFLILKEENNALRRKI